MDSLISIYTLAPFLGWLLAHVIKMVISVVGSNGKNISWSTLFKSGGMPSAHSAVMVATLTVIGGGAGLDSAVFGLAVAMTAIVIYDALNVRRSVGEQGEMIQILRDKLKMNKGFFTAYGHTAAEVAAGAVLGLAIGISLLQIL